VEANGGSKQKKNSVHTYGHEVALRSDSPPWLRKKQKKNPKSICYNNYMTTNRTRQKLSSQRQQQRFIGVVAAVDRGNNRDLAVLSL
jgi:hypothetical protein